VTSHRSDTPDPSDRAPREWRRLASFAAVGGLGFAVDAGILSALVHGMNWVHYEARAVSFAAAVTVTWLCNRTFVFAKTSNRSREYGAYFTAQLVGAVINLGTYAAFILLFPASARLPVVPLAVGAAVALLFNYVAASRFVFVARPTNREPSP
jgi:putative flippase GtrA